jgi:hypothetical protein
MTFTSNVDANLAATGTVKVGKRYTFKSAKATVTANKRTTVKLKLPKPALSAVKKALSARRTTKARITLSFTVASGIKTSITKNITLVR